ncbi:DUF2867 domain-containing protein [Herbaspirillum chlorophenolicum]|jgi:hypothetical protein|uniref:DUF2867 domain-containing protein n=1 Tax=Herbaspirillum chlorophenolicum TaxID=211589 RepID=UPI00067C2DD7|nr:DUF2867 domain-containing protein [Herbaspirillum chlorophenolicum]
MNSAPTSKADEIVPEARHWQLLPGADFADSYRIPLAASLAQKQVADIAARMMAGRPAWVAALLDLRNRLVAPFGLKGAKLAVGEVQPDGRMPGFPVLDGDASHLLLGLDDRHLDFRLCIEKSPSGHADEAPQWLTATTVVRTKGLPGKAYLAVIMPFHRRIVRTLLEKMPG